MVKYIPNIPVCVQYKWYFYMFVLDLDGIHFKSYILMESPAEKNNGNPLETITEIPMVSI